MSAEDIDDTLYKGNPYELCGELSRVSGVRDFGHVAVEGNDGFGGKVILTFVAHPDSTGEQASKSPE